MENEKDSFQNEVMCKLLEGVRTKVKFWRCWWGTEGLGVPQPL